MNSLAQLRLNQLISNSLPVGAFSYSQGLEWAVEDGWVNDETQTLQWCKDYCYGNLQPLDLPILLRIYQAFEKNDKAMLEKWSTFYLASRETKELRAEEKQRALAMHRVIKQWPGADEWLLLSEWQSVIKKNSLCSFAAACYYSHINAHDMLQGFTWAWLDNLVAVAIKIVPLGQTQGQKVLYQISELLPELIEKVFTIEDDEIGGCTSGLAIASSLHETQYSRLFRS